MPYVSRNEKGEIIDIHDSVTNEQDQWLETNNPELIEYLHKIDSIERAKKALKSTDYEVVRIVEDLIDLLMDKQVFVFTELPEAVQIKLNARRKLRTNMNAYQALISDDDVIFSVKEGEK